MISTLIQLNGILDTSRYLLQYSAEHNAQPFYIIKIILTRAEYLISYIFHASIQYLGCSLFYHFWHKGRETCLIKTVIIISFKVIIKYTHI